MKKTRNLRVSCVTPFFINPCLFQQRYAYFFIPLPTAFIYINVEDHDIRRCVAAQLHSDYERVKPCPAVTVEGDRPLTHTEVGYDFYRMKLEGDRK